MLGKYLLIALSAVLAALVPPLRAAASEIEFRTLSVNDGLSQSTVLALAQDPLGRIWMGTQDGLNRYDGYSFTLFRHDETDPGSLADNTVSALLAEGGILWIGTSVGLSRYDAATERFENFALEGHDMQVSDIAAIPGSDDLLLATDLGVVLFDRGSRRLELRSYLAGVAIHTLAPFRDGFLLGTSNGLYAYSATYGKVERVLPQLARYDIACILADGDGFWIATHGNGLFRIDAGLHVREHCTAAGSPGLVSDYIRVLKRDTEGRLWIGTFEGLSIRDLRTGRFTPYVHTSEAGALSHNSIRSIFIDDQFGVWLGTYYGGVSYYHPLARRFGLLRHDPSRNSLGDNTVSCIVEDARGGCMWIGTNDDGVNRYDRTTGRFTEYAVENGALLSDNVKCILPDGDGVLWIGTHAGGLTRLETAGGRTRHYRINADIPINNSCYALLDGGDGSLWVGSLNGLVSFDKRSGRCVRHRCAEIEPRLASSQINVLCRDSKRHVWIGTHAGLYRYDPAMNEVRAFDLLPGAGREAENSPMRRALPILCVTEDSHHTLWVGTRQGLFRYDAAAERFERFSVADGLPNDVVYGILEDDLARLWLSTNGGLACFDPARRTFRNYTLRDGIANNQFNSYSYCRSRDGEFWFGGIGGVTRFRPHDLVDNPFAPEAQIVGVEVVDAASDRRVRIDRDTLGRIAAAAFPSCRNIFSVRFVAVNPLAGGRNTFAYKLEGFNTRWYETSRLEAFYSNLKPGNYRFLVRAANNDGRWSDSVSAVDIRVLPMWWQTLAARILWVVLALGAVAGVIAAMAGRMRMRLQLRLERMEKASIEELSQEKIRFYINLSHELRTPLTLIMSPLQELREHGMADKYVASRLNYVYRNSLKLLHIVNQLLDYRKAELGMFKMKVARQDVDAIVAEVFSMFEEVAQSRDMDYILSSDLKGELLPVDRLFLEMMLTNLISNAFKFTPDGGIVRVALQRGAGSFTVSVRDSGVGIPAGEQQRVFERYHRVRDAHADGGIGLSIVRRIVELHQGSLDLRSEPGQGSEFRITLPDDPARYPEEKRAGENEVQDSIIRDDEKFRPEEWSDAGTAELLPVEEGDGRGRDLVLIAEPDADVAGYMADHFRTRYGVRTVADGNEVLELLKQLEPGVVIIDKLLPGMDGMKLCQAVKQNIRTCHIPVVLLSTEGSVEEQIAATEAGADACLTMPLSVSLLSATVQNLLKARYRMRHKYSDDTEVDPDQITSNPMDGEFLKKAIRVVEENMDNEEFSSNDFSKALCMSRSNLHLKMKSVTGESATKFIRKIRFNYACRLLLERRHSIAEISAMVGFNSPSYFATSFKKHVGCLPTEYVRQRKGGDRREPREGKEPREVREARDAARSESNPEIRDAERQE